MTTLDLLKDWFTEGRERSAVYMIVVCDTFSHEDYPVYVTKDENLAAKLAHYESDQNMQRVMEVYDLRKTWAAQKRNSMGRVFDY